MPKITITLQDAFDADGKAVCRASFKLDRQDYPMDAPPSPALMHAAALRVMNDLGIIERFVPLVEVKSQFDDLTKYLREIGALDENGNLHVIAAPTPAVPIPLED